MDRCAGLDWAKDTHQVCVLEADGEPLLQRGFAHGERDLDRMCELLVELGVKRIAIERPEGVLVERLLEAGLVVVPIHPNQLKAARPRFRASGGKSDAFDAFCLAELARTDHRRFRTLAPDSDETKASRALTRAREDLVKTKVSLTNRLQAELDAFWPGAAGIFCRLDWPIALAFLERYPSAEALAADAGMSAVAKESGRRKVATFRRACDKRLRDAMTTLADSSRLHDPWAKDIYLRARGRGCDHPHAIRVLGRAWLRVVWRMWQDRAPYDPHKHGARKRLNAARG